MDIGEESRVIITTVVYFEDILKGELILSTMVLAGNLTVDITHEEAVRVICGL